VFLGPGEKAVWLVSRIAPFLVLGLVPALAYWAFASGGLSGGLGGEASGEARTLLALACAGPILLAFLPFSGALQAIRRSHARMADPMYRARLIEFSRKVSSVERP
jgi:hypothetical protein